MKVSMPEMPPATLLAALGSYNLLPVIVFMPTRRRCDKAASEAAFARRDIADDRRQARGDFMRAFVEEHPEVRAHRHWNAIIRGGVAYRHSHWRGGAHRPWLATVDRFGTAANDRSCRPARARQGGFHRCCSRATSRSATHCRPAARTP